MPTPMRSRGAEGGSAEGAEADDLTMAILRENRDMRWEATKVEASVRDGARENPPGEPLAR